MNPASENPYEAPTHQQNSDALPKAIEVPLIVRNIKKIGSLTTAQLKSALN